jgi:hypothetical protein
MRRRNLSSNRLSKNVAGARLERRRQGKRNATMSTTLAKPPGATASTTAEDRLKEKSRDASVISVGHLVAKALKAEGVDKIFTLCGGHDTARRG